MFGSVTSPYVNSLSQASVQEGMQIMARAAFSLLSMGSVLAIAASVASAAVIDFSTATPVGEAGINLNGAKGTTTIADASTWSDGDNLFKIAPGVGTNGSQGIVTNQAVGGKSTYYAPKTSVAGAPFVAGQTILNLSFDVQMIKSDDSSKTLYRIFFGAASGSGYLAVMTIYANGNISIGGDSTHAWNSALSDGVYRNISLQIDYGQKTWSAWLDGDEDSAFTDKAFRDDVSTYSSNANNALYGYKNLVKLNVQNSFDTSLNQIAFDNFSFEVVPEPAAFGFLAVGALALLKRKSK